MDYKKAKAVSLKSSAEFNEKWLQSRLAQDPTLLGLGDLEIKDLERRQPHAGRLDMLLIDPETHTRYEVEIQLGATDNMNTLRSSSLKTSRVGSRTSSDFSTNRYR